jgi:hypothetical protein
VATSGNWRIYGAVDGLPSGTRAVDVTITAPATAVDATTAQAFTAATYAAITVPANATAMCIIPPSTNVGAITLKGNTADTGVKLHKTYPTVIALDASPTPGLLCANSITVTIIFM